METVNRVVSRKSAYLAKCPLQTTEFSVIEKAMPPIVHKAFIRAIRLKDAQKQEATGKLGNLYDAQLKTNRKAGHPLHELRAEFSDIVKRFLPLEGVQHSNNWPTLEQVVVYWAKWEEPFNRAIYGEGYTLTAIHHEQAA